MAVALAMALRRPRLGSPALEGRLGLVVAVTAALLGSVAGDDVLGCGGSPQVKLDFTSVSSSNLAGKGPELRMPKNIRFLYICSVDKTAVDALLEADKGYEPADPKRNGQEGRYGRISMKAGTEANFTLRFRRSGTDQRVVLRKAFLSFFNEDTGGLHAAPQGSAKVTVWGYAGRAFPTLGADPRMQSEVVERDGALTSELAVEKALATTFALEDAPRIHFTLQVSKDATGGREFYFAGSTCDQQPALESTSTTRKPPQPAPPRLPQASSADMFDCQAGLWNCVRGWSKLKKDWCIAHKSLDCEVEQGPALARLTRLASENRVDETEGMAVGETTRPAEAPMRVAATTPTTPATTLPPTTTTSTVNPVGRDWEACTVRPVSSCKGTESQWAPCEDLPSCAALCEPKDCEFTEWESWTPLGGCSGLCERKRRIAHTSNACGKPCHGPKVETQALPECLPASCAPEVQDCKWAEWSSWSHCSNPTEQQFRSREVSVHARGRGAACKGAQNETRSCAGPTAQACKLSEWGAWTDCSATCGGGWKAQMRRVVRHAENGGAPCEGSVRQDLVCNTEPCEQKVDCRLGDWSEWTGCGGSAAKQRYRERSVLESAQAGGKPCSEPLEETAGCEIHKRKPCSYTEWSAWSACPVSCGGGQTARRRSLEDEDCKVDIVEEGNFSLKEVAPCGTDACPVLLEGGADCDFSAWSEWEECSSTCGRGAAGRKRDFQAAARGGQACAGALQELKDCVATMSTCPKQDCEWGEWLSWSACTRSCGGGSMQRSRVVKKQPKDGGEPCQPEAKAEVKPCGTQSCDLCVDGAWSSWSSWSKCSASCGPGYQSRSRDVARHANDCGEPAAGPMEEHRRCEDQPPCSRTQDCQLSEWGEWSTCSCKCYGVRERDRTILQFARGGGKSCSDEQMKQVAPCNPEPNREAPVGCESQEEERPQACQLGAWGEWGECSRTCGGGQHTRARHVLSPSKHNGDSCTAVLLQVEPCGTAPCGEPCEDCRWGDWSEWGECASCTDMRFRHREVDRTPNHCGKPCDPGAAKEMSDCSSTCVSRDSFFCVWGEWSGESPCSANCGPATKTRSRRLIHTEVVPPDHDRILFKGSRESSCSGAQINVSICLLPSCSRPCWPIDCTFASWGEWEEPTCERQVCERRRRIEMQESCGGTGCGGTVVETKPCPMDCDRPVDCSLSEWAEWSGECARQEDQMMRGRTVLHRGKNGGKPCEGHLVETRSCKQKALPACVPVHCKVGVWSAWSACTVSCGGDGGLRLRRRAIAVEASCGGAPCEDSLATLESCGSEPCASDMSDCEMSEWTSWSECDNRFEKMRHRQVVKLGSPHGKRCAGATKEVQPCKQDVDCQVSNWIEWDACDKSCGGGQRQRHRFVTRPPMGHGEACPLELVETQGCNRIPCEDQDCEVGEWGEWTRCSSSCGAGQQSRARSLKQLAQDDGVGCNLHLSETQGCEERSCSNSDVLDCKWADWSQWSACSAKCDGGQRTRDRHISQYPKNGGAGCESNSQEELEPCNTQTCAKKECVDGEWGDWGEWEACSQTCEGGMTWRQRRVEQEANDCGMPALGPSRETAACGSHTPCQVDRDCAFGSWTEWSNCTRTCGGLQRRSRKVNEGSGDGAACEGSVQEERPCSKRQGGCEAEADEDGGCGFGEWGEWEPCPVTCGGAQTERSRRALRPAHLLGSGCEAALVETKPCGRTSCEAGCEAVDCAWSDWGAWSACDKCGGQRKRFRHVSSHPSCGGVPCEPGAAEETSNCTRTCHGELHFCSWEEWGSWGKCSANCGEGMKRRERRLSPSATPPPQCDDRAQLRFLLHGSPQDLGVDLLQQKFEKLHERATGLESRRLRELLLSYALGSVGLLAASVAIRIRTRALAPAEDTSLA